MALPNFGLPIGALPTGALPSYGGDTLLTNLVPSVILGTYTIGTLSIFSNTVDEDSWPLYTSQLPDGPNVVDNCAAVFDTTGYFQGKDLRGDVNHRYGIQYLVRCSTYQTGYLKAAEVLAYLNTVDNEDFLIGDVTYKVLNCTQTSPVMSLGLEPGTRKRRYLFSANLLTTIKEL